MDDEAKRCLQARAARVYKSTRLWTKNPSADGMRGELAVAEYFGAEPDLRDKPWGDGGIDIELQLQLDNKAPKWFPVDAKFTRTAHLLVNSRKVRPLTIYVLVQQRSLRDVCIGWEWGRVLMTIPTINWMGNGAWVHHRGTDQLRPMTELKRRCLGWRHAGS